MARPAAAAGMTGPPDARAPALLLDEMFPAQRARTPRARGHDVIAVAEDPQLRALNDRDVFAWAAVHRRRILTENVKDFRPLLLQAQESGAPCADLLLTSSWSFPRSRGNPAPLTDALDNWLTVSATTGRSIEEWLPGPERARP